MGQKQFQQNLEFLRKEHRNSALVILGSVYSGIITLFVLASFLPFIHWIWLVPVMGWLQYWVVLSGHEAVHSTLCYPKKLNEFFGVFGQAMVGVSFTAYRQQHLDHHKCRSFDLDPDAHIYCGVINTPRGIPRLLKLIFGTIIEIAVKIIQKGSGGYGTDRKIKPETQKKMKRDSLLVVLAQLSLMVLCTLSVGGIDWALFPELEGLPWLVRLPVDMVFSYAVLWILPLFGITVFLNRCRIVIEHGLALLIAREREFGGLRIPTVEVLPSKLEALIFAPYHFHYHCAHHLFMAVPHYNLLKLHELLVEEKTTGMVVEKGGYISLLWKLIWY